MKNIKIVLSVLLAAVLALAGAAYGAGLMNNGTLTVKTGPVKPAATIAFAWQNATGASSGGFQDMGAYMSYVSCTANMANAASGDTATWKVRGSLDGTANTAFDIQTTSISNTIVAAFSNAATGAPRYIEGYVTAISAGNANTVGVTATCVGLPGWGN